MYQFDWASRSLWLEEPAKVTRQQSQSGETIQGTMLLQWQEHCVECAVPLCYANCPLYVQRRDRKCARLVYGIVRNRAFPGLLLSGADLRFRRWGKLEAALTGRYVPVTCTRVLDIIDRVLTAGVNTLGDLLTRVKLLSNDAAPVNNTIASESCATTNPRRSRSLLPATVRPLVASASRGSRRVLASAGKIPHTTPARSDTPNAAPSTRQSTVISWARGMRPAGAVARSTRTPHIASTTPTAPPTQATRALSVTS